MDHNIKILFCGDTALKTSVRGADPFFKIRNTLNDYDVIFLNLETVVINHPDGEEKLVKNVCLYEQPEQLHYVASLGKGDAIKIVSLANNHILDYGISAAKETIKNVENFGITHVGFNGKSSVIINVKGLKICFLACYNRYKIIEKHSSYIVDEKEVLKDIKKNRPLVDLIVVSAHWGTEHVLFANPTQQKLARLLVDNGADLIIGHHPHCIQGCEVYKGKSIYYSLGNFNFWGFDRPTMKMNQKSIVVSATISNDKKISYQELPINIDNSYMPEIDSSIETVNKLKEISVFLLPQVSPLCFFRRAAKTHLQGAITRRLELVKSKPLGLFYFLAWLLAKPFNWGCYIALLWNFFGEDSSKFNEWE